MLNHINAKIFDLCIKASDIVAQTASQCFDISVWQFLAAFQIGGRIDIYPDDLVTDPELLFKQASTRGVTILRLFRHICTAH